MLARRINDSLSQGCYHRAMPNALIHESSPYLLQHAQNPVDWMPWGEAAFARAQAEDKPIFLSIGYATCHWCHVMERESFENEEIAAILNEHFVSIKVDREERPDVDAVYMAVTQGLSGGRGGWPMSVWLMPDRRPISAGTYFPPVDRFGRPGFKTVLLEFANFWRTRRKDLQEQAGGITEWLNQQGKSAGRAELSISTLAENAAEHLRLFDNKHAGFGGAPKFPTPHRISSVLRWRRHSGDAESLRIALKTLDAMHAGGIHDHLGGGYHRYSTDREWLVPHFEKMLYDQALLLEAGLDAFQATGEARFAEAAQDICTYVLRDLRDAAGGFYSAEDADSEGVEGKFYVWTLADLEQHLGADAKLAASAWGVTRSGNYHDEAGGEYTGTNILHLPRGIEETAKLNDVEPAALRETLARAQATLLNVRGKRVRPLLDDKVLTDWNGLWLGALARAGQVLQSEEYAAAARKCAGFLLEHMLRGGRLLHRWRKGNAGILAFADDYAFLGNAMFALHQATLETRWLERAAWLAREMVRLFWHKGEGLFHTQGSDESDKLIAPIRNLYDGAIPSGNSAAALLCVRMGRALQDGALVETAKLTLDAMSANIAGHPPGQSYALAALEHFVLPAQEIVIAGHAADAATQALITEARNHWLPRAILIHHESGPEGDAARKLIPSVSNQGLVESKPAAYVCENYSCQEPVTTAADLGKLLAGAR